MDAVCSHSVPHALQYAYNLLEMMIRALIFGSAAIQVLLGVVFNLASALLDYLGTFPVTAAFEVVPIGEARHDICIDTGPNLPSPLLRLREFVGSGG